MKVNDFPCVYNRMIEQQTQIQITAERQNLQETQNALQEAQRKRPKFGEVFEGGASVGATLGFVVCTIVCVSGDDWWNMSSLYGFIAGIITLIVCIFVGFGGMIAHNSAVDQQEERVAREQSYTEERINSLISESNSQKEKYADQFEQMVKQQSTYFSTSEQAQTIIAWMVNGFFRTIDSADRRKHIPKIVVPFKFDVYKDKIVCNLGVFDFELKRCAKLKNAVEQAALARAIASEIHLKIVLKYPEDASGKPITIQMKHEYLNDFVQCSVIYNAENGYYQNETPW